MFAEAELTLTSNGDLRKKLWIGYLSAGVKVFGPLAVVGWPVALPVIGASIANMGLNIDQAVNGKTAEERKAGIIGAVISEIDVLLNLPFLKGPGSLDRNRRRNRCCRGKGNGRSEGVDSTGRSSPETTTERGPRKMPDTAVSTVTGAGILQDR